MREEGGGKGGIAYLPSSASGPHFGSDVIHMCLPCY